MRTSYRSAITVTLLWLGSMVLLFFHVYFGKQKITMLSHYAYMVVTPFLLTRFFEKRSIKERFGFQRKNVSGLLVATYLGLIIVYFFDVTNFSGVFLAPLLEEIFFRGYMLGSFVALKNNEWKWRSTIAPMLFTSFLFAFGHLFNYYPTFPLSMWFLTVAIFIGSLALSLLYVLSKTILPCFLLHMIYNLCLESGIGWSCFSLLGVFAAITLFLTVFLTKSNSLQMKCAIQQNSILWGSWKFLAEP